MVYEYIYFVKIQNYCKYQYRTFVHFFCIINSVADPDPGSGAFLALWIRDG